MPPPRLLVTVPVHSTHERPCPRRSPILLISALPFSSKNYTALTIHFVKAYDEHLHLDEPIEGDESLQNWENQVVVPSDPPGP
jgi:hypothetical protein